jgi:peptide/nickel transport system substrate-binding protein
MKRILTKFFIILSFFSFLSITPTFAKDPNTLVVAVTGEIESLDVMQLAAPRAWSVAWAVYGNAMEWGKRENNGLEYVTYDFRPGLIESWSHEMVGDSLVYTLNVRKGCKYKSGNELTSADFVYRTERMQALRPWNNTVWGLNTGHEGYEVIDDYTFKVTIDAPNPISHIGMSQMTMMIPDSSEMKANSNADDPWAEKFIRTKDLGIGAYRIERSVPGVETVLVKNEGYCAPDYMQAKFDKILVKVIPDLAQQAQLLKSGEVDLAPELPAKELMDLMKEDNISVLSFNSMTFMSLGLNNKVKPFDNKKVRQALAYATPSADIIDAVYMGQGQAPSSLITKGTIGALEDIWPYSVNLDKAKSLLAEAGYPDGFDMDLVFNLSASTHADAAIFIKDSFSKIGVNVNLKPESPAAFQEKLRKKEQPTFMYEMLSWTNDAGYSYDMIFSPWGFANYGNYESSLVNDTIATAWVVLDDDERFPMYYDAQRSLDDDVPSIVITQPHRMIALRSDLGGYAKYFDEMPRYHEMYRK